MKHNSIKSIVIPQTPTEGICAYSYTGYCVASGKGALVCARTKCPTEGD